MLRKALTAALYVVIGTVLSLLASVINKMMLAVPIRPWAMIAPSAFGFIAGTVTYLLVQYQVKRKTKAVSSVDDLYKQLVENISEIVFSIDTQGLITYISPSVKDITGFSSQQLINQPVSVLIQAEDISSFNSSIEKNLSGQKSPGLFRVINKGGGHNWLRVQTRPIYRGGKLAGVTGVMVDVTGVIELQKSLSMSEENFKTIFNNSSDMIMIYNLEGYLIEMNETVIQVLGYSRENLLGMNIADFQPIEYHPALVTRRSDILNNRQVFYETEFYTSGGGKIPVEATGKMITFNNEDAVLCSIRDVSIKNELNREKERISKFKSINVLAAGIAHDFNNMLMGITGNLVLIKSSCMDTEAEVEELVDDAVRAARRMTDLTQQMLYFSQDRTVDYQWFPVDALINDLVDHFNDQDAERLSIEKEPSLQTVYGDRDQVTLVIKNMVLNAFQASSMHDPVDILFGKVHLDDGNRHFLEKGDYLTITIHDRGKGVPAEMRDKIFDPFFTTRAERSGLGLSTAYTIIQRHNGIITVDSPGMGSTFTVYLPLVSIDGEPEPA